MEVFLEVTVQHKKYHAGFMERMRQQPEVTSCYQVEGEFPRKSGCDLGKGAGKAGARRA